MLIKRIIEFFKAPLLNEGETYSKAYIFHKLLVGTMIITSVETILFWLAVPENLLRWLISISVINIPCLVFLYLNKKGYNKAASNLFTVIIFTLVAVLAWTAGGVKSPVFHIIPVFVLFVGLLKGWKQGLLAGLVTVLLGLGLVFADLGHVLPESKVPQTSFNIWLAFFTCIALIALLQYHAVENHNKAFKKVNEELNLRRKVEKELFASEVFRKQVFESSRIPIVIIDAASFKYIDCNQAAIEIYGFSSKDDVLGKTPEDFSALNQEDGSLSVEKAKYYIEKALVEGMVVFEWKHQRSNGEFWDAEVHLMSFEADEQKLLQFTLVDITDRKKAGKSLLENESRIRTISNNFTDGMIYQVVISPDGKRKFTYLSNSVKLLYGVTEEEAIADSSLIYRCVYKDDIPLLNEAEDEAGKEFRTFKVEARLVDPNGDLRWSSFVSTPTKLEDGSICWDGIEFIITDLKNAEDALKISESQYRELWASTVEGIVIHDKGAIIEINEALCKMLGYTREQAIGKSLLDFSTDDEIDNLLNRLSIHTDISYETKTKNAKGEILIIEVFAKYIAYNGKQLRMAAVRDITKRKQIENALKDSEEKYRYLMENLNEVVMMVDNNDTVLFVNRKFTEVLGYLPEEILGKIGYKILLDPHEHQIVINQNKKRIDKETNQYEIRFKAKDGRKIDFLISGAPITDSNGNTIGSIGAMTDITERKLAEKTLMENEELLKSLIELAPYGIVLNDYQGNHIMVNKAFCKDSGYEANELLGKSYQEIGIDFDSDALPFIANEMKTKGEVNNFEASFKSKQGKIIYCLFSCRFINMNNQNMVMTSSVNISNKKEIEKELEEYRNHLEILVQERTKELAVTNEELQSTNEELYSQREELISTLNILNSTQDKLVHAEKMAALGVLSAGIAHEINNPLNFIQGGALIIENYLKTDLKTGYEYLEPYINAINVGVKRASEIVISLNHYSRQDELPMTNCDLHQIIDHCLIMLQNQIKNKIELRKLYTEMPHCILGNEGKLHQAMLNIISNAEQAIAEKGIIEIKSDIVNNQLIVIITDSGSGINKENMQKIFDPFFTTKDPGKGTGLGLAITYNIIQEHNGTIDLESEPGQGTKVIIKLPINAFEG